jgi:hypothetical protein
MYSHPGHERDSVGRTRLARAARFRASSRVNCETFQAVTFRERVLGDNACANCRPSPLHWTAAAPTSKGRSPDSRLMVDWSVRPREIGLHLAIRETLHSLLPLMRRQTTRTTKPHPAGFRAKAALACPGHDQLTLELGQAAEHSKHQPAIGRDTVDHGRNGSDDYANALCGCAATVEAQKSSYDCSGRWISGPYRDEPDADPNAEWRRQRLLHYCLTGGYTRPW